MCAPMVVGHATPPSCPTGKLRRALPPSTTLSVPKLQYPNVRLGHRTRRTRSTARLPTRKNRITTKNNDNITTMSSSFNCDNCSDSFNDARLFGLHRIFIHGDAKVHHCPHCRSPYPSAKLLNEHIKCDHAEQKAFPCSECNCSFYSQVTKDSHVREAHRRLLIRCVDCQYETVHDGLMAHHVQNKHGKQWIHQDINQDTEEKKVGYLNVNGKV